MRFHGSIVYGKNGFIFVRLVGILNRISHKFIVSFNYFVKCVYDTKKELFLM